MRHVRTAVAAASLAYLANCSLGLAVATGRIDTSRVRWVHHAMYIATSGLTLTALAVCASRRHPAALPLAAAAVPLVLLQRHGARPLRRHERDAILAGPAYAAALTLSAIRS